MHRRTKRSSPTPVVVTVQVAVAPQHWRRLQGQADALTGVFGLPVSPEEMLRDELATAWSERERGGSVP